MHQAVYAMLPSRGVRPSELDGDNYPEDEFMFFVEDTILILPRYVLAVRARPRSQRWEGRFGRCRASQRYYVMYDTADEPPRNVGLGEWRVRTYRNVGSWLDFCCAEFPVMAG